MTTTLNIGSFSKLITGARGRGYKLGKENVGLVHVALKDTKVVNLRKLQTPKKLLYIIVLKFEQCDFTCVQ